MRYNLLLLFFIFCVISCARLDYVQFGEMDYRAAGKRVSFNIKLSERGINIDEAATLALGCALGERWPRGGIITLAGDLGAGKTTFCRGLLRALGWQGHVKSPTFTLVEPYESGDLALPVYHFDLYRLAHPEELEYAGAMDYFQDTSLCLIEWPEKGQDFLPQADFALNLSVAGRGRVAAVEAGTPEALAVLASL